MITYRAGELKQTLVAYANQVRIGYIDHHNIKRWLWSIHSGLPPGSGLHPDSGRAHGIADSETEARGHLEAAFEQWVHDAGLCFADNP